MYCSLYFKTNTFRKRGNLRLPVLEAISIWSGLFGGQFPFCEQDPQGTFFSLSHSFRALQRRPYSANDEIHPCGYRGDATKAEYVCSKCAV